MKGAIVILSLDLCVPCLLIFLLSRVFYPQVSFNHNVLLNIECGIQWETKLSLRHSHCYQRKHNVSPGGDSFL